jgi:hypothetical protein
MGLGRELWCPQDCNLAGVTTSKVFNLETGSGGHCSIEMKSGVVLGFVESEMQSCIRVCSKC